MYSKDQSITDLLSIDQSLKKVTNQFQIEESELHDKIEDVCNKSGINADFFIEILKIFSDTNYFPEEQLKSFPILVILDYLKRTHRYYMSKRLLEIEQSITQSFSNKPLAEFLQNFFLKMKRELTSHIRLEEGLLFPYITALSICESTRSKDALNQARFMDFSISQFEEEHDDTIENEILEVRKKIIEVNKTAIELSPYRILLNQLDTFENELRVHGLVEDQILVPNALELEAKVKSTVH